jgi:hypothetical protein
LIFLNGDARVIQSVFGQVAKKLAQGFGAMQSMAVDQLIDLPEVVVSFGQVSHSVTTG